MDLDSTGEEQVGEPAAAPSTPAAPTATSPGSPQTPTEASPSPGAAPPAAPKPEDQIIELSERVRVQAGGRKAAEAKLAEATGRLETLQPFVQLLELGQSDPLEAANRFAEALGLDAPTWQRAYAEKQAGGPGALTAEERVAQLEKREREREERAAREAEDAKKRDHIAKGDKAVEAHVDALRSMAVGAANDYPAILAEEEAFKAGEASHDPFLAAFDVMGLHWEKHGTTLSYKDALQAVEQTCRKGAERRATKLGYQRAAQPAQPARVGGLTSGLMGASPPPDPERIMADEDIDALGHQWFVRGNRV